LNGNPLKARLARQLPAFGGWCTTGSPFAAELIALQGFHFVGLDAQHGLFSYDSLLTSMMALARTGSAIVVRMPSRDAAAAGRILDAGAHGIIFPMIETPGDAREAVDACRIYPGGRRSFGPLRAAQSFGRDPDAVGAGVTCMAMIETARGVENIEAIAAVPGLDCLYIGPGDLAITMGLLPGLDPIPGPHADAIDHIRQVALARGVPVGMPCAGAARALELADAGFTVLTIGADTWWLTECARREGDALRGKGHLS
jgi:4-hydroxy-2-oxoheptanedioate aldolase